MKKLLIFAPNANTSGVTSAVCALHERFDANKYQISVISQSGNKKMWDLSQKFHGNFYALDLFFWRHPFQYKKILKKYFLQEADSDIFELNLSYLFSLLPLTLALKSGISEISFFSHSSRVETSKRVYRSFLLLIHYTNRFRLKKYRKKYKAYACSREAAFWMFGRKNIVQIVKNAVDLSKYEFNAATRVLLREEYQVANKMVIGHVGRLDYAKNQRFLLRIYEKIEKKVPESVLWMIGTGPLEQELKAYCKELGLSDFVVFFGNRNDVPDLLNAMDVFVLPSIFEGLPVSAVEAQANGLPCVISDAIDDSCLITDNSDAMSLNDSAANWADKVLSFGKCGRTENVVLKMRKKGWDINDVAEQLQKEY